MDRSKEINNFPINPSELLNQLNKKLQERQPEKWLRFIKLILELDGKVLEKMNLDENSRIIPTGDNGFKIVDATKTYRPNNNGGLTPDPNPSEDEVKNALNSLSES